jgi:hypothetical protein
MNSYTDDSRCATDRPETRASAIARQLSHGALWLLLGGWIGTWLLFGLVVAPTAFRVLPSAHVAGTLVGPVLEALQLFAVAAGLALCLLAVTLKRGAAARVLPLLMAAACLYSQFGLSAEIAEIRSEAFGPHGTEALMTRFTRLHQVSVGLYILVGVGALLLAGIHIREEVSSLD